MKTFKDFLTESTSILDTTPRIPHEENMMYDSQIDPYTDNKDEVKVADLGFKKSIDLPSHILNARFNGSQSYAKTELRHIDLDKDKIHFSQRSVNVGKVKHFINHYDADPKKMHKQTELRDWEAPQVSVYPDGNISTSDHHRLIACMLRGDKSTIARVTTWDHDPKKYGLRQTKTPKDKSIKQD